MFPTCKEWFSSVWPDTGSTEGGDRILVMAHEGGSMGEAAVAAEANPSVVFMFLVEDFDYFSKEMPELWRRPVAQGGGLPSNVWVGAAFTTNKELEERATRLLKIRARRLFLVAKRGHETPELFDYLQPWRCMSCGRRGFTEWPAFCPTGTLCVDEDKIMPQIGWLVDMDRHKDSQLKQVCEAMRVALWDDASTEVPE